MSVLLHAEERKTFTHSAKREIRNKGFIPAVVYGKNATNTPISLEEAELLKALKQQGRNGIFQISLGTFNHSVMVHEIQQDPLKGDIIHADFHVVNMNETVDVEVQIQLSGDPQGVKDGGVLQQPLHHVKLRAKPGDIPTHIEVNIASLGVNDTLHVKDLSLPPGSEVLDDVEEVIVTILPPKQEAEIDSGEEQEPGEPESAEGRETNE
ncbi:50S ribosomal protein L25/general stress protein Ctc [Bacillus kexueae]|uniref:50S ribosomal protein L25/general stress protein Ctc n=1 Tax=Aeribacillus kexueae TaxID=2078952 RepID=UPI001FAF1F6B|nr:50S ribosomal protein L25/general stress protein Ctc [Bacillus kexueae]